VGGVTLTSRVAQIVIGILMLQASLTHAQTPAPRLQFEVASIKASDPSAPRPGRLGSVQVVTSPGRISARNAKLTELIKGAYALEDYQVSGGPGWIDSARFDVEAKSTDSANRDRLLPMLRALLEERFKLAIHRETKDLAIYALVVAKGGPKFHALTADEAPCWPACAGVPGRTDHLRQRDLPALARFLTRLGSDKPAIDKTGLTGYFDLDLDMSKIMETAQSGGGPPTNEGMFEAVVSAIQDEPGLKLTPTKAPVEILVIDHAEKPSEN
jgi:uncharacterized protein (TIGR03435 family)